MKVEPFTKLLARKYGGKWKYIGFQGTWECDDGNRYCHRVATGRDMNGEYTGESSIYLYYIDGSKPTEVIQ